MKIIDAHTHASFEKQGKKFAKNHGIDYSFKGFQKELTKNKVAGAITISGIFDPPTPIEFNHLTGLAKKDKRLFPVCAINPLKVPSSGFEKLRKALKNREVYGIKIFLAYYPLYATDKRYHRFYKLAQEYDCPVIFHTGDTFGNDYLIKYSHPLQLDEVAVKFRKTKFVIAHLGNPWTRDAAQVIYKNPNVYADLSALIIGSSPSFTNHVINDVNYAYDYVSDPSKFMHGTDWPLIKMENCIKLMKKAIPKKHHNLFFYKNAKRLFKLPL